MPDTEQQAATGQETTFQPGTMQIIFLGWMAGISIVAGLVCQAVAIDEALRPSFSVSRGMDEPNLWPAALAQPLMTLGVVSLVAAVVLAGVRQILRER